MNPLYEDIRKCALALDEQRPGWHNEIDLATFVMVDATRCVLGQLGGWSTIRARSFAEPTGLNGDRVFAAFAQGTNTWKKEIQNRLDSNREEVPVSKASYVEPVVETKVVEVAPAKVILELTTEEAKLVFALVGICNDRKQRAHSIYNALDDIPGIRDHKVSIRSPFGGLHGTIYPS